MAQRREDKVNPAEVECSACGGAFHGLSPCPEHAPTAVKLTATEQGVLEMVAVADSGTGWSEASSTKAGSAFATQTRTLDRLRAKDLLTNEGIIWRPTEAGWLALYLSRTPVPGAVLPTGLSLQLIVRWRLEAQEASAAADQWEEKGNMSVDVPAIIRRGEAAMQSGHARGLLKAARDLELTCPKRT